MRALRAAIHDKQFSPAYYLYGGDDFLKEDALRRMIDAAVDATTRDFNLDQRKGADLSAETLGSLLSMPPMMAERRVVVIRDVPGLRKEARAVLEKHLALKPPDLLVLLAAPADAKDHRCQRAHGHHHADVGARRRTIPEADAGRALARVLDVTKGRWFELHGPRVGRSRGGMDTIPRSLDCRGHRSRPERAAGV